MMLAEASNEFMGAWFYALLALLGGVGTAAGIYFGFRKSPPVKLQDDPEINVRKAPKRFNHELAEQRHVDHERRILELEKARSEMINKLDADKDTIVKAGEERALAIHAHIESDRRDLEGKISDVSKNVNGMPDRIVALLRNLGAIQ